MNIKGIPIIKVATGETRFFDVGEKFHEQYREATQYCWQEGNFSCDCNRGVFFERCLDPEYDDDWDIHSDKPEPHPCGDTAYRVPYIELEDGTKILIDDDPELK